MKFVVHILALYCLVMLSTSFVASATSKNIIENPPPNKSVIFKYLMDINTEKCLKPLIHYPDRHLCCYQGPDNIDKYLSEECLYKYKLNSTHIVFCFNEDIIPFKTITETKDMGNITTIIRYVDFTKQLISKNTYPLITTESVKTTTTIKTPTNTLKQVTEEIPETNAESPLIIIVLSCIIIVIFVIIWYLGKEEK